MMPAMASFHVLDQIRGQSSSSVNFDNPVPAAFKNRPYIAPDVPPIRSSAIHESSISNEAGWDVCKSFSEDKIAINDQA